MTHNDDDDALTARLGTLFDLELERAERDLTSARTRRSHTARTDRGIGLLIAAGALLLAVIAVRPGLIHDVGALGSASGGEAASAGLTSPGAAAVTAAPSATIAATGEGFPTSVDGDPVLFAADADQALRAGGSGSVLVGGTIAFVAADCASNCGSGFLLRVPGSAAGGSVATTIQLRIPPDAGTPPLKEPVVVRLTPGPGQTCETSGPCSLIATFNSIAWP